MKRLRPVYQHFFRQTKDKYPNLSDFDENKLSDEFISSTTSNINYCFTFIPDIGYDRRWPQDVIDVWNRDWITEENGHDIEYVMNNYIFNKINGTTFSGHPTKTTLGNTLRSVLYAYHYIERAGLKNPWKRKDLFV